MKREYKLYLQDIKGCLFDIGNYINNMSEEDFLKDKKTQDAVARRLEIIGEASRNIPGSLKEKNKHVPWFDLSQFRDLMAHAYYENSPKRLWKIAKEIIPKIKEAMNNITLV